MKPKIKLKIDGAMLDAYIANMSELDNCGKASQYPERDMKLTDIEFYCVYVGMKKATENVVKYPTKSGNEYVALVCLASYLEKVYLEQRGSEINCG